jgi:phosphomannomutase/phosphoglucomutase
MDARLTSGKIKEVLISGLRLVGCDVVDLGMIPTPVLYFHVYHKKKDSGIMITASHNPPDYNGFKFRNKQSIPFRHETILKIKEIIDENNFNVGERGTRKEENIIDEYLEYIKEKVDLSKNLKVVIDGGNGTCGKVASRLFRDLGCQVEELYCDPDGNFPNHIPDPNMEETLSDLREKVVQTNSDMGIALDGDGDRVSFVDEKGNIIRSDIAMILFAKDILKKHEKPKIVHEVKFSRVFMDYVNDRGGIPIMTKVGYPNIVFKMLEEKSPLGGEFSGHFYFRENNYYEDAIFAAAKFAEILSKETENLSDLVKPFLKYVSSRELRIPCPDEKKEEVVRKIKETFEYQGRDINSVDGVRLEFKDGWGLIRSSNTEPELSVRFEATTKEKLEEIKSMVLKELNKQM